MPQHSRTRLRCSIVTADASEPIAGDAFGIVYLLGVCEFDIVVRSGRANDQTTWLGDLWTTELLWESPETDHRLRAHRGLNNRGAR